MQMSAGADGMDSMGKHKLHGAALAVLAAALCGCTDEGANVAMPAASAPAATASLGVGVTFKTDGRVWAPGSDALYQSLNETLGRERGWDVRRVGHRGDDFAPVIAAIAAAPAAGAQAGPSSQRLLVLVENSTEHPATARVQHFLSSMPFGAWTAYPAARHYDITIAYRDAAGPDHVSRVRQDLLFVNGPGLRQSRSLQAFDRIVSNSIDEARRGALAGQPQLEVAQRLP